MTYADDAFLLATKLIAQRAKDVDDIGSLADSFGLSTATPAQLEAHLRSYYTDGDALEFIVDGGDVDRELELLSQEASAMLAARAKVTVLPQRPTGHRGDLASTREESDSRRPRSIDREHLTPPPTPGGTRSGPPER